jgi:hypothetical protein
VASRPSDAVRDAEAALAAGDYRGAIRLCEQARTLERLSAQRLARLFGVLGRAYVALGEHDNALSYLKRADVTPATRAAARAALEALGQDDDPRFFERAEARAQKVRKRRFTTIGTAVLIGSLVVVAGGATLCLGLVVPWVIEVPLLIADISEETQRAAREGEVRGRAGDLGDCVEQAMVDLERCAPEIAGPRPRGSCIALNVGYRTCIAVTDWTGYCADLPAREPLTAESPFPLSEPWAEEECRARADRARLTADASATFRRTCVVLLADLPSVCASPALRPRPEP